MSALLRIWHNLCSAVPHASAMPTSALAALLQRRPSCPCSADPIVMTFTHWSGTKKEHKPKLLSLDIFWWGTGLPHEGVGAKKFGMSLETREIKFFWRDMLGFCWDIPGVPEKFEKKTCVQSSSPTTIVCKTMRDMDSGPYLC